MLSTLVRVNLGMMAIKEYIAFLKDSALLNGWLVGFGVLWHIKLCRLFNAKSVFMKIVLFQTIPFRISM